jgi:hypothetical protein
MSDDGKDFPTERYVSWDDCWKKRESCRNEMCADMNEVKGQIKDIIIDINAKNDLMYERLDTGLNNVNNKMDALQNSVNVFNSNFLLAVIGLFGVVIASILGLFYLLLK